MVDHGDEGWEFVGHRLGDGCCLDRHSRGHWRCCWSAPQSPALFHQGPEFGPQGFQGSGIVGCLGRFVLGLEFAETVFDLRQAVHGLIGFHRFCIKEFNRGRIPDFCKTVVVHLLPEHDDFTVQFMPETIGVSIEQRTCFFVRETIDVAVHLLKRFFRSLGPHFRVGISIGGNGLRCFCGRRKIR